ncbi:MAG TPA: hypothetical protein VIP70_06025, partial [Nitrososphaeraceae archaeon]
MYNILSGISKEQIPSSCSKIEQHYHQIDKKTIPQFNKVLVIGLGQLGLPVAKYIKDIRLGGGGGESEEEGRAAAARPSPSLFDVYGYDISSKAMERAEKTAGIKKATDFSGF